jgi:adenylate kinase
MFDKEKIEMIKKWLGTGAVDIFGRPFAGKDYQGRQFVELFGGNLVGGGEILRNSVVPKEVNDELRAGKLAPTDYYIATVVPYLSQEKLADSPLFLSSVGRWHGEEDGIVQALEKSNHPLSIVIYLNMPEDESYVRWEARDTNGDRVGRHDDTLEVLKTRFTEFREKTIPVIEHYRKIGKLVEIDGKQSREKVTADIIEALYERAESSD